MVYFWNKLFNPVIVINEKEIAPDFWKPGIGAIFQ
jgi:hypothetical protein